MGVIAMIGALTFLWFAGAKRAAAVVAGIIVVGPIVYLIGPDSRTCRDRAWFCDLIPRIAQMSPTCPDDGEPVNTRIFTEEYVDAEVRRLVSTGVCQAEAIARIHAGWGAKFAPEYLLLYGGVVPH
jgi:hypothetical protein